MPQKVCVTGCCKLRVREHITNSGEDAHVGVTADEVNFVLHHVSMETTQKGCRCVTFLGNFVVDVERAKRDCGESATDGRRSMPRTTRPSSPPVSLLDGQVVTVSVGVELVGDMRSVITSFLEDHHVEAPAGGTADLRGLLASWAWVPLEHGEAVLVLSW